MGPEDFLESRPSINLSISSGIVGDKNKEVLGGFIISFRDVVKLHQLKLVFEFLNNALPTNLQNLFTLSSDIHSYETNRLLHIPSISTSTYGINSIRYKVPVLWNNLFKRGVTVDNNLTNNVSIDQIHNVYQFKRLFKKHFSYNYTLEE